MCERAISSFAVNSHDHKSAKTMKLLSFSLLAMSAMLASLPTANSEHDIKTCGCHPGECS
jgi:hypothetical protein